MEESFVPDSTHLLIGEVSRSWESYFEEGGYYSETRQHWMDAGFLTQVKLWLDTATFEFFVVEDYEMRDSGNPEFYEKPGHELSHAVWKLAEYLEQHPSSREKIADLLRTRRGQQPREARDHDSDPR